MEIGPELRRLRLAKDWTQVEAAAKAGMSQSYYAQLETGARKALTVAVRQKLTAAFGLPLGYFDERPAPPPPPAVAPGLPGFVSFTVHVLGDAGAGPGRNAEDGESMDVGQYFRNPKHVIRVQGDSMLDAGISPGDYVALKPNDDPAPGTLVVVWLAGQEKHVLKVIRGRRGGRRWLEGVNKETDPDKTPIDLADGDIVCGEVTGVFGKRDGKPMRQ